MSARAGGVRRTLALLCVVSAGWAFSFGLGAPLDSLWLADHGCGPILLGINTAVYYAGIALTAAILPRLMSRSVRGCVVAGLFLSAVTTACFPCISSLVWWLSLRCAGGAGTALCLIPLETLVNKGACDRERARDFGLYASAVALGIGAGTVVGLPLYAFSPWLAFACGGLLPLLVVVPAWRNLPGAGIEDDGGAADGGTSLAGNGFSFATAWTQGFLEGGMVTFLSVYLVGLGFNEYATGVLMGILFVGVVAFQMPAAWLADRGGRVRVLLACHGTLLVGLLLLPHFRSGPALAGLLFLVGGSCASLYPLGLALLGERLPQSALGRANAYYLASNCAGSVSGPVLMGLAMSVGGSQALFACGAASVALAVLCSRQSRVSVCSPIAPPVTIPAQVLRRAA